jgi:hypothetical protein
LIDRLAVAAGLLEALMELPGDTAPVIALVPKLALRARRALEDWGRWNQDQLEKTIPRG